MAQKLEWLLRGSRAAVSFSTEWPQEFGLSQSSSWGDSSGRQAMAAIWGSFTVSLPPGAPSRSCPPSWELPEPGPREGPGLRVRTLGLVDRLQLETASVCPPEGRWSSRGSSLSSGALPGALQAALGAPLTTGAPSLITRAGLGSQSSCSDSAARSLALRRWKESLPGSHRLSYGAPGSASHPWVQLRMEVARPEDRPWACREASTFRWGKSFYPQLCVQRTSCLRNDPQVGTGGGARVPLLRVGHNHIKQVLSGGKQPHSTSPRHSWRVLGLERGAWWVVL